jgi:hypothetical protein
VNVPRTFQIGLVYGDCRCGLYSHTIHKLKLLSATVSPSMGEFRFHMREGWHDLMEEAFDTLPLWSGFSTQTCEKIGERLPSVDGCSSAVFAFYPSDSRQPMCFVECTDHLEFMASKVSMALWVQRYPEKVPLMPHTRVFPWDVAVPLTDCASIFTDSEVWVLKRDGSSGGQAVWLVDTLESIEATIKGEQAMLKSLPFHEERDFIPVRRAREERRYRHIALTPPPTPRARAPYAPLLARTGLGSPEARRVPAAAWRVQVPPPGFPLLRARQGVRVQPGVRGPTGRQAVRHE